MLSVPPSLTATPALSPEQISRFAGTELSGEVSPELAFYICQMETEMNKITVSGESIKVGVSDTGNTFFFTGNVENPSVLPKNQPLSSEDKAFLFDALLKGPASSSELKAATAKIDSLEDQVLVYENRLKKIELKSADQRAGLDMMRDAFADLGLPARVAVHGYWNFVRILNGKNTVRFPTREVLDPGIADYWKRITSAPMRERKAFPLYPRDSEQPLRKILTCEPHPENQVPQNSLPPPQTISTHFSDPPVRTVPCDDHAIDLSNYGPVTRQVLRDLREKGLLIPAPQQSKKPPDLASANNSLDEAEAKIRDQKARLQGLLKNIPLMPQGPPTPAALGIGLRDGSYRVSIDTPSKRSKVIEVLVGLTGTKREIFKSSYASIANLLLARQTWEFDDLVRAVEDFKPKDQPGKAWAEYVWAIIGYLQKAPEEW